MGPIIIVITFVICFGAAAMVVAFLIRNTRNTIGYVAMPNETIEAVIAALDLTVDSVLIDLGAGDGRVLAAAKRAVPGVALIGYENNRLIPHGKFEWHNEDLFAADVTRATHVVAYLHPDLNKRLAPKLTSELLPGAKIITIQYDLPGWQGRMVEIKNAPQFAARLFVYER